VCFCLKKLAHSSKHIGKDILRWLEATRKFISWIQYLPKAISLTIARWIAFLRRAFTQGLHAVKVTTKAAFLTATFLVLALPAILILIPLLRLYLEHHHNRPKKLEDERQHQCRREEIERQERAQGEATRRWQQDNINQR
jgi:hypothetical protein